MNKKFLVLNKKVGQTPLEVIENFKKENSAYENEKMAYAGRLDPMAEGKMLVLVGDECKKRDKYLNLDKEYEVEILLDFFSDTGDVLGLGNFFENDRKNIEVQKASLFAPKKIQKILNSFKGKNLFPYPLFSSKTVLGKPLFLWKLEGKENEIEIPKKEVEIYYLKFLEKREISKKDLEKYIFEKIEKPKKVEEKSKQLGADFRRAEIRQKWKKVFENFPENKKFTILKIKCRCSSGTYMRVLSEQIAEKLETKGLALSIKRTKIGKLRKFFGINFFSI